MKRITVLGSTGSIGTQTLDVARWRGYRVSALAAWSNAELLLRQAEEFRPDVVACSPETARQLQDSLPAGTRLVHGAEGMQEAASWPADTVVAAIPGMAGLPPLRAALAEGRHVALAGKEAMVIAAPLIRTLQARTGAVITPVDSEHSGVFQCLVGEDMSQVHSLVITASGGPFLRGPADLTAITPEQALKHPNWSMGRKVTIDSATLFNKGLEVLEAQGLFDFPLERIEVLIHPQQLVHGLVRFADGSVKAQLGPHDMRPPIQYGIEYPARPPVPLEPLPLEGTLEFLKPDTRRFPALELAYEAGRRGGFARTWLNAADEIAVSAFLAGQLDFPGIPALLEAAVEAAPAGEPDWDDVFAADLEARRFTAGQLTRRQAIL